MYLTEKLESAETLSVFEKIAQISWGDVFTWNDLGEFVITVAGVVSIVLGLLKWVKNNFLRMSAPYREYKEVIDRTLGENVRRNVDKYYISTRCQDKNPCNEEEIYEFNGKYVTEKLIPFFCKKAFKSDSFGKYYIILADSGMGKTTFLVRLYRDYVLKVHLWPRKKLKVCFVPLTETDWDEQIAKVEHPGKTILLLDALDENKEAIKDCNGFLKEVLTKTSKFNKVVLTCRTQFFPNQKSEPKDTGLTHAGIGRKSSEFIKKYITPFSDREVRQYLRKRFKLNLILRFKAKRIVKKVPAIMARPLILYWIDLLVDRRNKPLQYAFEIYGRIIDKWIERECGGQWNDRETGRLTKKKLRRLSSRIAQYMLINENTVIPAEVVEHIAEEEDIDLEPIIAKSRSLLNRNSNGEYKFAHRSFLEFLLAKRVFRFKRMPTNANFLHSMSGFRMFFFEYLLNDLRKSYSEYSLSHFCSSFVKTKKPTTVDAVFGTNIMKLYSVRNYRMYGSPCLLLKVCYLTGIQKLDVKDTYLPYDYRFKTYHQFLVQEIVLYEGKENVAEILSNRLVWADGDFYEQLVMPYLNEIPSIRYVDWDVIPGTQNWDYSHFDIDIERN